MSDKIRLGFAGCGGMAGAHLNAYGALKKKGIHFFDIVAVCDPALDRAESFAERIREFQEAPEAHIYASLDEMLDKESLHAVDSSSPHHLHHVIACACMEAGVDVMVEKPLGVTIRAGWEMVETSKRTGSILATAEQVRRWIGPRTVEWAIRNPALSGQPRLFFAQACNPPRNEEVEALFENFTWRQEKMKGGGGVVNDGGVHYADFLRYCYGEPETVDATCGHLNRSYILDEKGNRRTLEWVDTLMGHLRFKNGVSGTWTWTGATPGKAHSFTSHYGDLGCIHSSGSYPQNPEFHLRSGDILSVDKLRQMYLDSLGEEEKARLFPPELFPDLMDLKGDHGVQLEAYDFLCAVRDRRPPELDGLEGLKSQAISEAYLESSFARQSVRVQDILDGKVRAYQEEIDDACGL